MSKNFNSIVNQTITGKFVEIHVVTCLTGMVEYILNKSNEDSEAPFNYDDIENTHPDNSEAIEELQEELNTLEELEELTEEQEDKTYKLRDDIKELEDEQEEYNEAYEWWEVSSYLLNKLQENGQMVIPHMNLWGRQTSGQAILLDHVISVICEDMGILEGQENSWE